VPIDDHEAVVAAVTPRTRAIYTESLSNPTLVVADIPRLAQIAHAAVRPSLPVSPLLRCVSAIAPWAGGGGGGKGIGCLRQRLAVPNCSFPLAPSCTVAAGRGVCAMPPTCRHHHPTPPFLAANTHALPFRASDCVFHAACAVRRGLSWWWTTHSRRSSCHRCGTLCAPAAASAAASTSPLPRPLLAHAVPLVEGTSPVLPLACLQAGRRHRGALADQVHIGGLRLGAGGGLGGWSERTMHGVNSRRLSAKLSNWTPLPPVCSSQTSLRALCVLRRAPSSTLSWTCTPGPSCCWVRCARYAVHAGVTAAAVLKSEGAG
jgi:hypothetical protein